MRRIPAGRPRTASRTPKCRCGWSVPWIESSVLRAPTRLVSVHKFAILDKADKGSRISDGALGHPHATAGGSGTWPVPSVDRRGAPCRGEGHASRLSVIRLLPGGFGVNSWALCGRVPASQISGHGIARSCIASTSRGLRGSAAWRRRRKSVTVSPWCSLKNDRGIALLRTQRTSVLKGVS